MSQKPQKPTVEVRCGHCGDWIRSPIAFGDMRSFDTSQLIGNKVKCPRCGKWTSCNKENMRLRGDDEGFLGRET